MGGFKGGAQLVPFAIMRRVQVLGFSRQSIISVQDVYASYEALPAWHRRGIGLIRYDPLRQVALAINQHLEPTITASVQASYYGSETLSAIIIWKFHSAGEFRHIFYHEVGHFVFSKVLTQALRDRWFYEIRANEGTTVSSYACTNSREDFSECYATWFTDPATLEKCPLRYRFFQTSVFGS